MLWARPFDCAIKTTGNLSSDGRRVSDEFIVPVCRVHHRELHRSSNEAAWWRQNLPEPWPAGSAARRRPFERWELKLALVGRDERGRGSLG
jgi:hypothetical protein